MTSTPSLIARYLPIPVCGIGITQAQVEHVTSLFDNKWDSERKEEILTIPLLAAEEVSVNRVSVIPALKVY